MVERVSRQVFVENLACDVRDYSIKYNMPTVKALEEILDGPIDEDLFNEVWDLAVELKHDYFATADQLPD